MWNGQTGLPWAQTAFPSTTLCSLLLQRDTEWTHWWGCLCPRGQSAASLACCLTTWPDQTPAVTVLHCVDSVCFVVSEQNLWVSTEVRDLLPTLCLLSSVTFITVYHYAWFTMWKTEFCVCRDGINHVSVMSLSLMLLGIFFFNFLSQSMY